MLVKKGGEVCLYFASLLIGLLCSVFCVLVITSCNIWTFFFNVVKNSNYLEAIRNGKYVLKSYRLFVYSQKSKYPGHSEQGQQHSNAFYSSPVENNSQQVL